MSIISSSTEFDHYFIIAYELYHIDQPSSAYACEMDVYFTLRGIRSKLGELFQFPIPPAVNTPSKLREIEKSLINLENSALDQAGCFREPPALAWDTSRCLMGVYDWLQQARRRCGACHYQHPEDIRRRGWCSPVPAVC